MNKCLCIRLRSTWKFTNKLLLQMQWCDTNTHKRCIIYYPLTRSTISHLTSYRCALQYHHRCFVLNLIAQSVSHGIFAIIFGFSLSWPSLIACELKIDFTFRTFFRPIFATITAEQWQRMQPWTNTRHNLRQSMSTWGQVNSMSISCTNKCSIKDSVPMWFVCFNITTH